MPVDSTTLSFYLHGYSRSLGEAIDRATTAEELGYRGMFLADSQINNLDPFQVCAVAALQTRELTFGTAVTNMVYRDPSILACSAVTTGEISGGRFVLGLGTGDGPVYGLGRKATPVDEFERGVVTIRELVNGRPIRFVRDELRLAYQTRPVPVFLSVEGPRGLRVAGRVADGVILGSGFDLDVLRWARMHIAEGASDVGRDPEEVDLMAAGMVYVHDDGELARTRVRSRLANRAHHNFRYSLATVPTGERDHIRRFMEAFDITRPIEQRVPAELVSDYLVHRFSIAGTPEECIARVEALKEAGINTFLVTPPKASYDDIASSWAREVMAHFSPDRKLLP